MDPLLSKLQQSSFPFAEQDLRAAAMLRHRIAQVGRKAEGVTVPYGELVRGVTFQLGSVRGGKPFEIDPSHWTDLDRRIVGEFLGYLSRESYLKAGFLASALVVDRHEKKPSRPFFKWMRELGALPNLDDESVFAFWIQQLRKAHQWYKVHADEPVPGIEATANVCGGEPRLAGTRIPVWLLEQTRRLGASDADLLHAYPLVRKADLESAWTYVQSHTAEIERQITENEEA